MESSNDSDEDLPDLFTIWTQECSHITPNTSHISLTPECEDTYVNKSSGNKSPFSRSETTNLCCQETNLSNYIFTKSVNDSDLPRERSEDSHEDSISHPGPSGEDTSCPTGSNPCIISSKVLPIDAPSTSCDTGKKTQSPRWINHPTFNDPSSLRNSEPACQDSKPSHSKGETILNKVSDELSYRFISQASNLETDKPSCNGIAGEECRKSNKGSNCDETDDYPSLILSKDNITHEEFQANRMHGDASKEETFNHMNTEDKNDPVSNCVDVFSLYSKHSHSKGETMLNKVGDELNYQFISQASNFETDKPSCNGIAGETYRKSNSESYCNEMDVYPSLVLNKDNITHEEFQANRMHGDATKEETFNHMNTENKSHPVSSCDDGFSLYSKHSHSKGETMLNKVGDEPNYQFISQASNFETDNPSCNGIAGETYRKSNSESYCNEMDVYPSLVLNKDNIAHEEFQANRMHGDATKEETFNHMNAENKSHPVSNCDDGFSLYSKHSHSKGETMLNKVGDEPNYQSISQASNFETDKPPCNGIARETCRKSDSESYCNEMDVYPSLVQNKDNITPEEFQANRMHGDGTKEETFNHTNTENKSHPVSNCDDGFSLYKEDIKIGEPFMCKNQSPYYPDGEGREVPVWNQDHGHGITLIAGKYPVGQESTECYRYTSSGQSQRFEESEAEKSSDSSVLLPQYTNFARDQTSEDIFNMCHQSSDPVIMDNETSEITTIGEYSHFPQDKIPVILDVRSINHGSKDVCFDTQVTTRSGYETWSNNFSSDLESIPNTTTVTKHIKIMIKKINGTYACQMLGESGTHGNHTKQLSFCSRSSDGSRAELASHQGYNMSGGQSYIEIKDGNTSSDDPDSNKPHVEKFCQQFRRNIENLRRKRLEKLEAKKRIKEKHMRKVRKLKERYKKDFSRLDKSHAYDMDMCSLEIQAIDEKINIKRKYILEGKKLLQDMLLQ